MKQCKNSNDKYQYRTQKVNWKDIGVEIRYCPNWSVCDEGYGFAHLEIISDDRQRLPITETGYKSHFIAPKDIEKCGGAREYALAWLDEAGASQPWRQHISNQRQGCLF